MCRPPSATTMIAWSARKSTIPKLLSDQPEHSANRVARPGNRIVMASARCALQAPDHLTAAHSRAGAIGSRDGPGSALPPL